MDYTQYEQDLALKTLSGLVKENKSLRDELHQARLWALRLLLSGSANFQKDRVTFLDDGIIRYGEDFEKILPYFFFQFYPNSNANKIAGLYESSFRVQIKNGTSSPELGTTSSILEKIKELEKRFDDSI